MGHNCGDRSQYLERLSACKSPSDQVSQAMSATTATALGFLKLGPQ